MSGEWKSAPARLMKMFQRSRDAWRERSLQYQQRIKALAGEVRDLRVSREKWKADAKQAQQEIRKLRRQLGRQSPSEVADVGREADGGLAGQTSILRAATTLVPSGPAADAAPPFCPRPPSFTATR